MVVGNESFVGRFGVMAKMLFYMFWVVSNKIYHTQALSSRIFSLQHD